MIRSAWHLEFEHALHRSAFADVSERWRLAILNMQEAFAEQLADRHAKIARRTRPRR